MKKDEREFVKYVFDRWVTTLQKELAPTVMCRSEVYIVGRGETTGSMCDRTENNVVRR